MFLVVMLVILFAFSYAFHLLLKDSAVGAHVQNTFETVPLSLLAVFEMMFGAFGECCSCASQINFQVVAIVDCCGCGRCHFWNLCRN